MSHWIRFAERTTRALDPGRLTRAHRPTGLLLTLLLAVLAASGATRVWAQTPPPAVSSVSPSFGSSDGGTFVTISGTGFEAGATVAFGGAAATDVTVVSSTQITASTPISTAGPATVTVTNPDLQSGSLLDGFTFTLQVTAVNPSSGPTAGGTDITVSGSGFATGATVAIGGAAASNVLVVSGSQITATTPAGTAGARTVVVTNPNTQSGSLFSGFTYVAPPPAVTSITPPAGSSLGGTVVTIQGSGFVAGATVDFGGASGTGVSVTGDAQIQVTTPPHGPGPVDVSVTNPDTQTVDVPGGFTFDAAPPPTVTGVTPATGSSLGGTAVVVAGSGFAPGASVTFGGVAGTGVSVLDSTSIAVTTPANVADAVVVEVTNPDGQSGDRAGAFAYLGATPTIGSVTPSTGSSLGGTVVTITGTEFEPGATVTFDGAVATGVTVTSSSELVATTPAGNPGAALVTVTNPSGQGGTISGAFQYLGLPPTVSAVTPATGTSLGGTVVTVTGAGFEPGASVTFGGVEALGITVVSATELTVTTPPHAAGIVTVIVTNPLGEGGVLASAFTYNAAPPPVVSAVSPASGQTIGGTVVTITGSGFAAGATVRFGGAAASQVTFVSASSLTATTPPASTPGAVSVVVLNPDGQTASVGSGFEYVATPPPTITGLSPNRGSTLGGTQVTIVGTGFRVGTTVRFGTNLASGVQVVSSTQIVATTPAGTAGAVSVTVTNTDSQTATLPSGFTYEIAVAPTVTSVTPATGPAEGGTTVTISGTGFRVGATVTFGGVAATDVVVVSDTQITAKTPAQAAGAVTVVVTNTDGRSGQRASAFTYTSPPPTVTTVAPLTGSTRTATDIVITGTGFRTGATVTVGGVPATDVRVVSATQITARVAPAPAAVALLFVTNPDGQRNATPGTFTFVEERGRIVGGAVNPNGLALVVYSGGTTDELVTAARQGCGAPRTLTLAVLRSGSWLRFIAGAPTQVNDPWRAVFVSGIPSDTPVVVRCDQGQTVRPTSRASAVRGRAICIDAGHGGSQAGASYTGPDATGRTFTLEEQAVNLDVARHLGQRLRGLGARVWLTRASESELVGLVARSTFCNDVGAEILVSVHTNAVNDPRADGRLVLYANDDAEVLGAHLSDALWTALRDTPHPFTDWPLSRSALTVIETSAVPAVLVEPVFLSNPWEAQRLRTPIERCGETARVSDCRRRQIADALLAGIETYFESRAAHALAIEGGP